MGDAQKSLGKKSKFVILKYIYLYLKVRKAKLNLRIDICFLVLFIS